MEEWFSAMIFSSLASGAGNFIRVAVHDFFFSHPCCTIFFFDCKGFAGNLFLKSSTPPPPPKDQMVDPLGVRTYKPTGSNNAPLVSRYPGRQQAR